MYKALGKMRRKEALTNRDIAWLVQDGLWSFKQGLLSLTGTANYLIEIIKWVNNSQLTRAVK